MNHTIRWYYRDREAILARRRARRMERSKDPQWSLWWSCYSRAKARKILCTIKPEHIIIPEFCPILGIELVREGRTKDNSPSVDRKIPELGYTPENIQVISFRANRLKSNASVEELEAIVHYMRNI